MTARTPLRLHISTVAKISHTVSPFLRRHLKAAHAILNPPLDELSLALVADQKMSEVHLQFMSIAGPTDVLTFPLEHDRQGRPISGEVVICVPEARRQCRQHGVTLREELLLYALHGLLHLCGFDDRTKSDFRRMHRMEDEILKQLGVGPVFDRRSTRPSHRPAASPGDD